MIAFDLLSCHSPSDLYAMAGVEPPSAAIECIWDAAYACTPGEGQLKIWRSISKQPWPIRRMRRIIGCLGRRGLKTCGISAGCCVFEALCVPHWEHAAPGSRIYFVVVCPLQAQAREALRAIKATLDELAPIGVQYEARDLAGTPEIVIKNPTPNGVERVIAIQTADAVAVRGYAVAFAAIDEAGFMPSEEWLAQTDRDVVRALGAGQVQFPDSRMLFTSSPGAPQGIFHELVTKPPADSLVIRAASWVTNPRITESTCRKIAGDDGTFEQEFAARRFGYYNENFIPSSAVRACMDLTSAGPRAGGHFIIGLDVGQLRDDTGIVVASCGVVSISNAHEPVRHVHIEHSEGIKSDKKNPTAIDTIAERVDAISHAYGGASVVFDLFAGPTLKAELKKRGFTEAKDERELAIGTRRKFLQLSMAPTAQTPRWKLLRDLILGRRLHMTADHEDLARELSQLRATQQSSGALKVEGKKDNQADPLALVAPIALLLPPSAGERVEQQLERIWRDEEGWHSRTRWSRVDANGRRSPAECPEWSPAFAEYAQGMIGRGESTPAIARWLEKQRSQ
jgi:hypothetical protein